MRREPHVGTEDLNGLDRYGNEPQHYQEPADKEHCSPQLMGECQDGNGQPEANEEFPPRTPVETREHESSIA